MLPDVLQGIGESTYVRSGQRQRTRLVRRDAAADEEHLVNGRQSTPVLPRPQAKQGVYVTITSRFRAVAECVPHDHIAELLHSDLDVFCKW